MKIENWNGYTIRFISQKGEWCAVAADIAKAMGFLNAHNATHKMKDKYKGTAKVITPGGEQEMITLNEKGIYRLIMRSNKPEAEVFQDWVYDILKSLREASGLEGFQIFRMLDKDHQKEAMGRLNSALAKPARVDFIKANTIANKAVSNMFGYPKMIKKGDMKPEMLVKRQTILDDTVNLIVTDKTFNLGISVSEKIYQKYH